MMKLPFPRQRLDEAEVLRQRRYKASAMTQIVISYAALGVTDFEAKPGRFDLLHSPNFRAEIGHVALEMAKITLETKGVTIDTYPIDTPDGMVDRVAITSIRGEAIEPSREYQRALVARTAIAQV